MGVIKITLESQDGSVHYLDDEDSIKKTLLNIPRNLTWKHGAELSKLRNQYFRMITELAKNTNSGYTKTDLHNAIKPIIMRKFKDFPHYYTTGVPKYTTTDLNREGWLAVIEQLKVSANDIFNYTFK